MTMKALGFAAVAASLLAVPAFGHHSFAMFDSSKTMVLSGTVKEFEWVNPHAWIHLAVADPKGKPVTWSFEGSALGQLAEKGWKGDTLKAGDKVTIAFNPLKDGSHGGRLQNVKFSDGRMMCDGEGCGKPPATAPAAAPAAKPAH